MTNFVEFVSICLNIGLIVNEWTDRYLTDTLGLKILTILCIICVWYKAFTWMRLFEQPALFRNTLYTQIIGIGSFMLMLIILNGALANIIYIVGKIDHTELPEGQSR